MIARLRTGLLPLLASLASLIAGLSAGALATGRIDPLDWLMPCGAGLALLVLFESRGGRALSAWRAAWLWAITGLPPILFCVVAAARLPAAGLAAFGVSLGVIAAAMTWAGGRNGRTRWSVGAAALLFAALLGPALARVDSAGIARGSRPAVGVLSALPLYGAADSSGRGMDALRSVGTRAPLIRALEPRFALRPLDGLDESTLAGLDALLLAQPRLLRPAELVALDRWVRGGGHVVILADPLLYWSDPRPLGAAGRAPLTSLLDPLFSHWGLILEPARIDGGDPVERRALADGVVLQLAGASRFATTSGSSCELSEAGLIARCRIGAGEAGLVADADWANDTLWTLDPAHPGRAAAWTSDAVPILSHLLADGTSSGMVWRSWLMSPEKLVSALRLALVLMLATASVAALKRRFPSSSHSAAMRKWDHKENISPVEPDSG